MWWRVLRPDGASLGTKTPLLLLQLPGCPLVPRLDRRRAVQASPIAPASKHRKTGRRLLLRVRFSLGKTLGLYCQVSKGSLSWVRRSSVPLPLSFSKLWLLLNRFVSARCRGNRAGWVVVAPLSLGGLGAGRLLGGT